MCQLVHPCPHHAAIPQAEIQAENVALKAVLEGEAAEAEVLRAENEALRKVGGVGANGACLLRPCAWQVLWGDRHAGWHHGQPQGFLQAGTA